MSLLTGNAYNKYIVKEILLKYSYKLANIISNLKLSNAQWNFMHHFAKMFQVYIYSIYIYQYYILTLPVLHINYIVIIH